MSARYRAVFKDGQLFAEYENGELVYLNPSYIAPKRSEHAAPMIMRDIGEYVSPLDGSHVTSRSQHRDHMRAHDVVEVGNEKIGNLTSASATNDFKVDREIAMGIKRRTEEVLAMPQADYDQHVQKQAFEHAQVASLITADE